MGPSRRAKSLLLLAVVVVMINLPVLQSTLQSRRLARDGVEVTVPVVHHEVIENGSDTSYLLAGRLAASVDEDESVVSGVVDHGTYSEALLTGSARVRVLPGRAATAYRFDGEVSGGHLGWWLTLGVDALLALAAWWVWRGARAAGRDRIHLEATEDLTPATHGRLEEGEDGRVEASGQVVWADEDEVVLDVGTREVVVVLDGHRCEVAVGDLALARGRRLE